MERVYLIGYMGCGKTTIGKRLAKSLGWDVIDMDSRIENRYRKTIPDIFASEGEESFRKKERFILEELSSLENVVVSTGGGAPCFFDNIDVMNSSGLCVYIRMTPEALAGMSEECFRERAFAWRGRAPLERNLALHGAAVQQNCTETEDTSC